MNYWMTTHWPPIEDENSSDFEPEGVYLPDGRQQAGADLAVGDIVLIYQSQTGRSEIGYIRGRQTVLHRVQGKRGIIAVAEVAGNLKETPGCEPTRYTDGTQIWWRWNAPTTLISTNGFVPLRDVNRVLGYSANYNLRAFGDHKSGLKKLTEDEYLRLLAIFKKHPRRITAVRKAKKRAGTAAYGVTGEESEQHRALKHYVASNPSGVLGEHGLTTLEVEYQFPTGDRADILLEDAMGCIVGVEVEVSVDNGQLEGILQAIKYRFMSALMHERRYRETRAFLVAYTIADNMKRICAEYEVEYFEVDDRAFSND